MNKVLLPPALCLLLAACQQPPLSNPGVAPPAADPLVADCGALGRQDLVGQPEAVLAAMTFVQGTRIFRTGDALTMDYSPTRLNIEIGDSGVIVAVSCG